MIAVKVSEFRVGDVEDPDLYAAIPLAQWESSEEGEFAIKHSLKQPEWIRLSDPSTMSYVYRIVAYFDDATYVLWKLKF
jgi:hypothetical protein